MELQIEELEGPSTYEAMPTEETFYLTVVRYESCGWWSAGPAGPDKAQVIKSLQGWGGEICAARIYAVQLPSNPLPTT